MKLVSPSGEHEVDTTDMDPADVTTYRARGYATKDEHTAAEKAQAEHDDHMKAMADATEAVTVAPPTVKQEKAKS